MIKIKKSRKQSAVPPFLKTASALIILLILGACGQKPDDTGQALAVINGKPITISEFDVRWSQLPDYARKKYPGPEGRK